MNQVGTVEMFTNKRDVEAIHRMTRRTVASPELLTVKLAEKDLVPSSLLAVGDEVTSEACWLD